MPTDKKMNAETLRSQLTQFIGSERFFRHGLRRSLVYTQGVQFLAENGHCFWILDIIASWQSRCLRDLKLREMQFWTLRRVGDNWELICERDTNDIAFKQVIEYSDFPLPEIKLYVCRSGDADGNQFWVLMLPSEY